VLFATAEVEPLVSTGGLAAASAGLVAALRRDGITVSPVVPGYSQWALTNETVTVLDVPAWVGPATVRVGNHPVAGEVHVIDIDSLRRPHPYVDPANGGGWRDNDHRFFAWSCAVAAWARVIEPDIVHLNDWHAATVLAHLDRSQRSVFSIHNLAHQGWGDPGWESLLGFEGATYRWSNSINAMAGAIALADRVVTVSPRYAAEICTDEGGMGLAPRLRARGDALVGILNGIDTDDWDPGLDPEIVSTYGSLSSASDLIAGKAANQAALCAELALDEGPGPLVVSVSRFDHQKGIDMVAEVTPLIVGAPARLALLGSGDRHTEAVLAELAERFGGRVAFRQGYDAALAHRMFAAGDLALIPSRFEPCGLTQMQAMRYGTIPIVTDVGGLHDTVIDVDSFGRTGTGIVMAAVSPAGIVDGVHRGVRLATNKARMARTRRRVMKIDWSWAAPARQYRRLYEGLMSGPDSLR